MQHRINLTGEAAGFIHRNVLMVEHADIGLDMFLVELQTEKNRVRHTVHKSIKEKRTHTAVSHRKMLA